MLPISNVVKTTMLLPCAEYDRYSNPEPVGCDWIVTPPKPGTQAAAPMAGMRAPSETGSQGLIAVLGIGGALAAGLWLSRRRDRKLS